MSDVSPVTPETPAPLTAPLGEIAAKSDGFSLAEYRKSKEAAPEPLAEPVTPSIEAKTEPEVKAEEPNAASEAGKALAAHKSGLEKRKESIQQTLDRMTHDKYSTERELTAAKAELKAIQEQIATAKGAKPEATATGDDPEPEEEGFERYGDFVKAQARWQARQIAKETIEAERTRSANERGSQIRSTVVSSFNREMKAEFERDPAFKAAHDAVTEFPTFGAEAEYAWFTSARRIDLAKHFVKHPAEAKAFAALTGHPRDIQTLMESRLPSASSGPELTLPVTKAIDPPKPVGAAPTASPTLASVTSGPKVDLMRYRAVKGGR